MAISNMPYVFSKHIQTQRLQPCFSLVVVAEILLYNQQPTDSGRECILFSELDIGCWLVVQAATAAGITKSCSKEI
jgi:hypothetical protein